MATGTLSPTPRFQFFDNAGVPLAGGLLYSYAAGTLNPQDTYNSVNISALTANTNPIVLNSAGRPTSDGITETGIYLNPALSYKFVLKTSAGVTLWTQDNCSAVPTSSGAQDVSGVAGETLSIGQWVYLSRGDASKTAGRWYKTSSSNAYSSTIPQIGVVLNDAVAGDAITIRTSGRDDHQSGLVAGAGQYLASSAGQITATVPAANIRYVGQADSTTAILMSPNPPVPAIDVGICEGRLTLTTATPVTTGDVTAATAIYFTPFRGNRIALYDGTQWILRTFTEISIAVPSTTNTMYDLFIYDNAGTATLEALAWTNDTTRATALTTQDGILSKTGALTRRYLGSFRTTGSSGQTEDSFAKRYLWNYYNRVARGLRAALETTDSWNYTTATWRQANLNPANQLEFVVGVAEALLRARVVAFAGNGSACTFAVGIGLDATNALAIGCLNHAVNLGGSAVTRAGLSAQLETYPAVGRHFAAWLEISAATGTTTWYGDDGSATTSQSGISGFIEG